MVWPKRQSVTDMVPFLFNVMKETFWSMSVTDQKHLCDLGPFPPEQMVHTQLIYAVFQPPAGVQVTLAEDLSTVPHGQFFGDVHSGIAGPDVPVRTVRPVPCLQRTEQGLGCFSCSWDGICFGQPTGER